MSCDSTAPKPSPLASVSTRNGILKSGCVNTGCLVNRAFRCKNALSHSSAQFHSFPLSVRRWSGSAIWVNPFTYRRVWLHTIAGYHMAQFNALISFLKWYGGSSSKVCNHVSKTVVNRRLQSDCV
ncbi:hypothetical protein T03_9956 [Trichinella britovi]|uniref:Uncharacterized protein n=1 Tax=Trichinella britovi TaxID=45882 RepID=A0A0V1C869_TRIBR|nr:hypothetical protein T03_9956 [Trichinella britovi]